MESSEDKNKYLPLGTVVKLKNGTKSVMITGFCMYDNDNNHTLYDYCGCLYPEGMLSNKEAHLFNHDDINDIVFLGYSSEEDKKFKVNLTSMIQIIQKVSPTEEKVVFETKKEEAIIEIE